MVDKLVDDCGHESLEGQPEGLQMAEAFDHLDGDIERCREVLRGGDC